MAQADWGERGGNADENLAEKVGKATAAPAYSGRCCGVNMYPGKWPNRGRIWEHFGGDLEALTLGNTFGFICRRFQKMNVVNLRFFSHSGF